MNYAGQKNLPERNEHPNQNPYQIIHIHYRQNKNDAQKDCKCHGELKSEDRPRIAARLPPRKTVGSWPPRSSVKATKLAHFEQNRYSGTIGLNCAEPFTSQGQVWYRPRPCICMCAYKSLEAKIENTTDPFYQSVSLIC
jgi:hypothetical protein